MAPYLALVALLALLGGESRSPEKQVISMTMLDRPCDPSELGYGTCQWLYPLYESQEEEFEVPDLRSAKPVFYAAVYGDSEDNTLSIVLDESEGTDSGYDVLFADCNNDNRIDPTNERFALELSGLTASDRRAVHLTFSVRVGDKVSPYTVSFAAFRYKDDKNPEEKIHANARNSSFYVGEAVFSGAKCKIALADLNSNGLFNDPEESIFGGDRFFVDLDGDGKFEDSYPRWIESFPYGRFTKIGGAWYAIVSTKDGTRVEISRAHPVLGKVSCANEVASVVLRSKTQSAWMDFADGEDEAPVGSYMVTEVYLPSTDPRRPLGLRGKPTQDTAPVVVAEGMTTELAMGTPLRIRIDPCTEKDTSTIGLQLVVTGRGGEVYSVRQGSFEVRDAAGSVVASATFKPG